MPKIIFLLIICAALFGVISSPAALTLGVVFTIFFEPPFPAVAKKAVKHLLKISVVGLGFGISYQEALDANIQSFGFLSVSVIATVCVGLVFARLCGLSRHLGFLITSGTAICGGSAIAATAPAIKADSRDITVALAIVFTLNSLALVTFPPIGRWLELSQYEFGMWAAIAIHDTSSVVGAALNYGDEALSVATTLKLSRTLWIIPLALVAAMMFNNKGQNIIIPYFIFGFVAAIAINSSGVFPVMVTETLVMLAKRLLVVVLFLVGASLSFRDIISVGAKPFVFAVILWLTISIGSLWYIIQ